MHLSSRGHCVIVMNNRFAANLRSIYWVITHPSKVKFTTGTMTVIIVLKTNYFRVNMEKQKLNQLSSAYRVASLLPAGHPSVQQIEWLLKSSATRHFSEGMSTSLQDSVWFRLYPWWCRSRGFQRTDLSPLWSSAYWFESTVKFLSSKLSLMSGWGRWR